MRTPALLALIMTCVLSRPLLLHGSGLPLSTVVGYDCAELYDFEELDETAVDPCPLPATHPPVFVQGSLLQSEEVTKVRVFRCHAKYLQNIVRCGMHSHVSSPIKAITTGMQTVSRAQCLSAVSTGILQLHGKTVTGLRPNQLTSLTIVTVGKKWADGTCEGADYTDAATNTEYSKVVVERHYEITVAEEDADYDNQSGNVVMPDGVAAPFTDLELHDGLQGDYYWSPLHPDASTCTLRAIYTGPIELVDRADTTGEQTHYAVVSAHIHMFAVKLLTNVTLCDGTVTRTEHPRLYVFFGEKAFTASKTTETDLVPYINTKFLYHEIRWSRKMEDLADDVVTRRCEQHRRQLQSNLDMARHHPESVSTIFQRPGTIGRRVGDRLYLAHCRPTRYWIRRETMCYDALPVRDAFNNSLFLQPVTRIAAERAEPVPCDGPFTPAFNINGTWWAFDPLPHRVSAPRRLKPDGQRSTVFPVESTISTAGLYPPEDMRRYSKLLSFTAVRTAVINTVSRAAIGETFPPGTLALDSLIDGDQALRLVQSGFSRLWGWFAGIGMFFHSVVGILLVWRCVSFVFQTTFNCMTIARAGGCTFALLGAFCTSLTHLLVQRQEKRGGQRTPPPPPPRVPLIVQAEEGGAGQEPATVNRIHQCPVQ